MLRLDQPILDANQHIEAVLNTRRLELVSRPQITPCMPATIKVLMVADSSITFGKSGFGLQKVIDTLREPVYDFARFDVSLAHRQHGDSGDGDNYEPKYNNFRFDQTETKRVINEDGQAEEKDVFIINSCDQIWCFAFAPDTDALTDPELDVLTTWMNKNQGGLLAMGDHDELGAAMCSKIPRVSTMRYWKQKPNHFTVPPAVGPSRYNTNRPTQGNTAVIPSSNQSDAVPQPVEVKPYPNQYTATYPMSYWPHPILCDPKRGTINVFPDHGHEGRVVEDRDIDLSATYKFGASEGFHYPSNENGYRPVPEVIAWANTLGDPSFRHSGGYTPPKRFGLVSVYDGNQANVGRVVVDTTWHHWLNINLEGLESGNTDAYALIQSYFRNVGLWLSRSSQRRRMLCSAIWNSVFTTEAMEVLTTTTPIEELGNRAREVLRKNTGGCMLLDWIQLWLIPTIQVEIEQIYVDDPLCLTCPPIAQIQDHLLGGVFPRNAAA